jgi:hypothetical protein
MEVTATNYFKGLMGPPESFEQNKVVDETAVAHKFYIGYKFYNKSG